MTAAELHAIAADLIPPVGATSVCLMVVQSPDGRLRYAAAWWVDHRSKVQAGPAFDRQRDARALALILGA